MTGRFNLSDTHTVVDFMIAYKDTELAGDI